MLGKLGAVGFLSLPRRKNGLREISRKPFFLSGGQGRNRTTDTRIFQSFSRKAIITYKKASIENTLHLLGKFGKLCAFEERRDEVTAD